MWRSKEKSLTELFSSKKMMIFQISRLGSIGSQFKYHWRVYLDDADDLYSWFCEKILKIKKLGHFEKNKKYTTLEGTEGSPGRICLDIIPHAMRGVIVA